MSVNVVGSDEPTLPTGSLTKDRGAQGQNGPQPSSLGMGKNVNWAATGARQPPGALNTLAQHPDPVLDALKSSRGKEDSAGSWQTRTVSDKQIPTTVGHKPSTPNPAKVPTTISSSEADPVRKP